MFAADFCQILVFGGDRVGTGVYLAAENKALPENLPGTKVTSCFG
jgi:hypothetical protein